VAKDHPDVRLTLIGVGEQADQLHLLTLDLGLSERVYFAGMIPAREVVQRLQTATALVLPSRWDGWGLVVNEALSMGVPAIVSDQCGASDLIRNGYDGYVFRSEDAADLEGKLRQLLEHHDPAVLRTQAQAVGEAVSIENIVPYFTDCLKHMGGLAATRPVPPWQTAVERI
jgi:glycosyltransferase involved in cell wall biosynthesis